MFRAIGFVIILWGLSVSFGSAFTAFNDAATETFKTIEMAATVSQARLEKL